MYLYGHFGLAPKKCMLEFLSEKIREAGKARLRGEPNTHRELVPVDVAVKVIE